jgi:hypothetical protein
MFLIVLPPTQATRALNQRALILGVYDESATFQGSVEGHSFTMPGRRNIGP